MKNKLFKSILLGLIVICIISSLFSCKKKNEETVFSPQLETQTKCEIEIAGNYYNFEALEAEFDRFNDFYPNVDLIYTYLDNYK